MALTSLLTAIATAVLGLFLMLRMSYGSVWSQGPSVIDAPDIPKQAYILISTLQTSPLQPLLSLLTTTALFFSLVVAVNKLHWRLIINSSSKFARIVRYLIPPPGYFLWSSLFVVPGILFEPIREDPLPIQQRRSAGGDLRPRPDPPRCRRCSA